MYAETIKEIAKTPTLLSLESTILNSKIDSLTIEITNMKKELDFTSTDIYEWLIGAQQRIAYAEDALSKINSPTNDSLSGEKRIAFKRYMIMYPQLVGLMRQKILLMKQKSKTKKLIYSEEFISKVNTRISEVEDVILDANVSSGILNEAKRRYNAALISKDNNFLFATLYDLAFAEAYIISETEKQTLETDELEIKINELLEENSINTSLWGNLFLDHAKFFIKTAENERILKKEIDRRNSLNSSYDLIKISANIEKAKIIVEDYIVSNNFEEYESINEVGVTWNVTKKDTISIYLYAIAFLLAILLVFLIYVGLKSGKPRKDRVSRIEKVSSVLNRLDKALTKEKYLIKNTFYEKTYEKNSMN